MVIQSWVRCHFLTHGCKTCQHQKPEHVCSASKRFCKAQMLLSFFYTSTWPSAGTEKCGCSFTCDKSQVCTCCLSHTVLSQLVTTHLLLWPVENSSETGMPRRWHESQWFKDLWVTYFGPNSHTTCILREEKHIFGRTWKKRSVIMICWPFDDKHKVSKMVFKGNLIWL